MVLKDDGKIETKGELDDESMPPMEDASDVEYPVDGELLVIKKMGKYNIKTSFI